MSEEFIIWTGRGVIKAVGGESVGGRAVRRTLAAARTTVTSHRPPEKQKEATRHPRDNQRVTRGGRKLIHQKMMQGWAHSFVFLARTHTCTHTQTQCLHISFGSSRKTVSKRKSLTESRAFSTQQHNHVSSSQQSDCKPPTGLMFRVHKRRQAAIQV